MQLPQAEKQPSARAVLAVERAASAPVPSAEAVEMASHPIETLTELIHRATKAIAPANFPARTARPTLAPRHVSLVKQVVGLSREVISARDGFI